LAEEAREVRDQHREALELVRQERERLRDAGEAARIAGEEARAAFRYTPVMTLKNAALLALVGVTLATIVLVVGFVGDVFAVVRGLIPAMRLLPSLVYAFAALSLVVFLYAFHKAQS
jgi:hypothetical protein